MPSLQDLIAAAPGLSARPGSVVSLMEIIDDPVVEVSRLLPIVERDLPAYSLGLDELWRHCLGTA